MQVMHWGFYLVILHVPNYTAVIPVTLVSSIDAIQIYNGMTDWNLCNDSFPEKL